MNFKTLVIFILAISSIQVLADHPTGRFENANDMCEAWVRCHEKSDQYYCHVDVTVWEKQSDGGKVAETMSVEGYVEIIDSRTYEVFREGMHWSTLAPPQHIKNEATITDLGNGKVKVWAKQTRFKLFKEEKECTMMTEFFE